jgi:high-affinity iron transporter
MNGVLFMFWRVVCAAALAFVLASAQGAETPHQPAEASQRASAEVLVHLLDYIGVDYAGAVHDGKVTSEDEYREMVEFSMQVSSRIGALPANSQRDRLTAEAAKLSALVSRKAAGTAVAQQSSKIRWMLIEAYRLQVSPKQAPDLASAARLYTQHCVACHGAQGRGDGPAAKGLDPAPADFHNAGRMSNRSLYGLYSTITLGVAGTSMTGFSQLPEEERWALAFYVANLGVPAERVEEGRTIWKKSDDARAAFPDFASLATLSSNEVKSRYGAPAALAQDYLRAHPEAVAARKPEPIALARQRLAESMRAYEKGDRARASELAISAYLDGFELAESSLDVVDRDLRLEIERQMIDLRSAIAAASGADKVHSQVKTVDAMLERASERLSQGALSEAAAFAGSLIILLREGMEAILILAALIAFVVKTGRRDALRWLHAGWIAALVLGALTWVAATYLIDISGANREITEGATALVAAGMLLYVGYWLHGKSQSRNWSRYLREKVDEALGRKTLWTLASVSFLAVYRELFEVILFYQALWAQAGAGAGRTAVLAGVAAAAVILLIAGGLLLKYSVRLPLGPFFSAMLWFVLLIAFVFAGDGVAKLQEAGVVSANPVDFIALPLLGVHPTLETLGAQLAVVAAIAFSFWLTRKPAPARSA